MELRRSGFAPEALRVDTREALVAALDSGGWEVLIADYQLPGWSGLAVLKLLQEREIDVPFIVVSGAIGEETAVDTMKAGAHDYVLKENLVRLGPAVERELREVQVRRERRQAVAALHELASRSALLASASRTLAVSLNYEQTLQAASRIALPEVADWCVLAVIEERPRRLRPELGHTDAQLQAKGRAHLESHPLDARFEAGVGRVLRTGKPAWLPAEEVIITADRDQDRQVVGALGCSSALCVPLSSHGEITGALTLVRSGRTFPEDYLAFAEELAARIAMAFDSARLYRQASDAIRARDEFLSVASHELNTPLATLTLQLDDAFSDDTYASALSPADRAAMMTRGRRQLARLARLVDSLLDISRLTAKRLELERAPVDLTATAKEVADHLAGELARSGSTLRLTTNGPVLGNWDPMRVAQIITNLLSNACKYGAGKPIDLKVEALGNSARLTVADHGIGIAAADLDRIFECFERAVSAKHYGGLGLGLYITRQVVEAHGGSIEVASEPGQGSTFTVQLPMAGPS